MLGVCNKIDEADEIFALGHENLRKTITFPSPWHECLSRTQRL